MEGQDFVANRLAVILNIYLFIYFAKQKKYRINAKQGMRKTKQGSLSSWKLLTATVDIFSKWVLETL